MKKTLLVAMLVTAFGAHAQNVYKYEKNGVTVYSSTPAKGAVKVELTPISIVPSSRSNKVVPVPSSGSSGKAGTESAPSEAQKTRESKRAEVLAEELAREKELLTKAEAELTTQEGIRNGSEKNYQKVIERLQPYKDAVALHKKNIEALHKEQSTGR